jgi:antirestriction protein ArdC
LVSPQRSGTPKELHHGIDQPVLENQAAYLQSWLDKLKKEPEAFVKAAARAQKATDWILSRKATATKPDDAEAA